MFDAAIGPRLEASSLRILRVFSAAGTFDVAFAAAFGARTAPCGAGVSAILFLRRSGPVGVVSGIPYLSVRLRGRLAGRSGCLHVRNTRQSPHLPQSPPQRPEVA